MNVTCSQPPEKKRRIVYDPADFQCALTNQNNEFLETLEHNDVYLTIDLSSTDEHGNTALHSIFKQYEETDVLQILEIFFEQGWDLNIENYKRETALHLAVAKRMRKAIDLLIQNGAEINRCDDYGNFITHYFVEDEYEKFLTISELDEFNFGLKRKDITESDSADFVEFLISRGFDFGARVRISKTEVTKTALQIAIERNLQHILPTLLRGMSFINYVDEITGATLLHVFLQMNDRYRKNRSYGASSFGICSASFTQRYAVDIVRIFNQKGVSVNTTTKLGETALHIAARNMEEMDVVEVLLEYFTNVRQRNYAGDTVYNEAIRNSTTKFSSKVSYHLEIARALLAKGANINGKDRYDVRPVFYTVSEKKLPALELLKEYGADFSYITKAGQNLLHLLAFKHDNDKRSDKSWETMFDLLISENCFDINKLDKSGESPLHLAIKHYNVPIIRKLLAYGADVNCKNADGARPLDRVGAMTKTDGNIMLKILLDHGAHVNARDIHGGTALSHAIDIKSTANVDELLKHGADINEPSFLDLIVLHHDIVDNPAAELIIRHYVKLKVVGMPYAKEYDNLVSIDEYLQLYRDCLREIDDLKSSLINDRVSLYQWLHMSPNDKCSYIDNEMLKNIVNYKKLEDKFPMYSAVIFGSYREAKMRESMMEPAMISWRRMTRIKLQDACIERVFDFLDNADLLSLSEDNFR